MSEPLLLFSTNTRLAYLIAQHFYGEEHYVWCTSFFDARSLPRVEMTTPPTSSPAEIYRSLQDEVSRGDRHSHKIRNNRSGLVQGAGLKRQSHKISDEQYSDIVAIIDAAQPADFRPLLYIMPFEQVRHLLRRVAVADRAHPLSIEYVVESLPRRLFDILEWEIV